MKFAATIIPFLASFASAKYFPFQGSDQSVLADHDNGVPGENPLKYCHEGEHGILNIDHVNIIPDPPKPGATLTIEAKGNFTEEVGDGAYIRLTVKYGLITLLHSTADLCEQMKNVDEDCPLAGEKTVTKEVSLPKTIPPGTYHVIADVYTVEDEPVICLSATVQF